MANIQQWWLVSYGDNFEQRWVFEVRSDADALALATGGKIDPVPATMAQLVIDTREIAARLGLDGLTGTAAQIAKAMERGPQS